MATSTLGKVLPLILGTIVLAILGAIGFVVYSIAVDVADKTNKKMEKKNMSFSRDGMKVGVKEVTAEQVGDSTQSVLVNTWNKSGLPPSKLKFGWGQGSPAASPSLTPGGSTEKRNPFSRTSSTK